MTATTHTPDPIVATRKLFMALELGDRSWKLGSTSGLGQRVRERNVFPGDIERLLREVQLARKRFSLSDDAEVVACYEAGHVGFWLHRCLTAYGIRCHVVDSSSIETNRRRRRAKTDRLDVQKLASMLCRYEYGDHKVWSIVRVPTVEEEDRRHLHRELTQAKRDRIRLTNRIRGLLATQGIRINLVHDPLEQLDKLTLWDGSPVPPGLRARVRREWEKILGCAKQIRELEAERRAVLRNAKDPATRQAVQLLHLKGIGVNGAWTCVMEFFSWRNFRNRRELGGLSGLTPTPYQSGDSSREQGISKSGNRHVRGLIVELAWCWLRWQPESRLSRWFEERFAQGGPRQRKIGIVALARKLLIELWRFLKTGALPEGAELKSKVVV